MSDLRARLAEVLAKIAAYESGTKHNGEWVNEYPDSEVRAIVESPTLALARWLEDAERYRWLRDTADDAWEVRRWIDSGTQELHYGENMDTAIDAARNRHE